jgi:probable HAF family extracellular repeat protein
MWWSIAIDRFSIVGVATPAFEVAGDGPYTTLDQDFIYRVPLVPLPARPTTSYPECGTSNGIPIVSSILNAFVCHRFRTSYLVGEGSRTRILNHIVAALPMGSVQPPSTTSYTINDLGTLGKLPGGFTCGQAINNVGQITGHSNSRDTGERAFLYTPGVGIKNLGTITEVPQYSGGWSINASGQVTGYSVDTRIYQGISSNISRAFLYSGGAMNDIGTLPGSTHSYGYGINDVGQITGSSVFLYNTGTDEMAFLYTPGEGMKSLGTLPGFNQSTGYAINALGHVTGGAFSLGSQPRAFLYTPGTGMIDLGLPAGYSYSQGRAINNSGQVTGFIQTASGEVNAFLYTPGSGITKLPTLMGSTGSFGRSINSSGQIVGNDNTFGAILYTPGKGTIDLNTVLLSGSGWTLVGANGINDSGQITGCGSVSDGSTHAFLLTPNR